MAGDTRDILWRFLGDSKSLDRASGKATKSLGGVQKGFSGAAKAAGALGLALGAREVAQFAGDAVQLAVSAAEVESKFEAVFGSADELRTELSELGDVAGITDQNIFDLAATFGNLAQAQGITKDDTADLTVEVAELAADMASFNDSDPQVVFNDLNKALLTTEREGMKKYGIAISEIEVKTRAAGIAAADGRDEVTKADRAYAAYEIAVEQAGSAIGDLERTQDSLANKQRQATAELEEMKEEIGRGLIPVYEEFLGVVSDTIGPLGDTISLLVDARDATQGFADALKTSKDPMDQFNGSLITLATSSMPGFLTEMKDNLWKLPWEDAATGADNLTSATEAWIEAGGGAVATTADLAKEFDRTPYMAYSAGLRAAAAAAAELAGDAEGAARKGNAIVQAMRDFISLRDVINGGTTSFGITTGTGERIMHSGGVVPGHGNVPAILQGGERVIPRGGDSGGGVNVTVNMGVVGDPYSAAQVIADLLTGYEQVNGSRRSGVA